MIKREASAQTLFGHYLRAHPLERTTWYETKQTRTHSIAFNAFQDHQLDWLVACKHAHTNYKIPDDSRGVKPVDGIFSRGTDAFVVIKYPGTFVLIDIDVFLKERETSERKSLLFARAVEIADKLIQL